MRTSDCTLQCLRYWLPHTGAGATGKLPREALVKLNGIRALTHRRRGVRAAVRRERVEEPALVAAQHRLAQPAADQLAVAERDVAACEVQVLLGVVQHTASVRSAGEQ